MFFILLSFFFSWREQDQTHNINLSKMGELLSEKQSEVESLQKR